MQGRIIPLSAVGNDLIERWRALAKDSLEPNPFFEPHFVLAAARFLERGDEARLLYVEDGRRMVFAMPVLAPIRYKRFPVPAIGMWKHSYCFLGTPLVAVGLGEAAWSAAIDVLVASDPPPWLVVEMLTEGPAGGGWPDGLDAHGRETRRILHLERGAVWRRSEPDYLADRISGRDLKSLRRRRRRLGEQLGGEVRVTDRAQDKSSLGDAIESFLRIEASGWKGREGGAFAVRPGHAEFFREICANFAASGQLQMLSLEVDGRPAAMVCNFLTGSWLFNFKIAYDEELARYSPGSLLDLEQFGFFHRAEQVEAMDSCTTADNPVVNRLYPDRRRLSTLLVHLRGHWGRFAVRHTTDFLDLVAGADRVRAAVRGPRYRAVNRPRSSRG